jgi:hypothetical protein
LQHFPQALYSLTLLQDGRSLPKIEFEPKAALTCKSVLASCPRVKLQAPISKAHTFNEKRSNSKCTLSFQEQTEVPIS